jgi:hypothetical protein
MRRKWEKGDFVYFSSHNFLLELSVLCGSKKPPKKPHGVRAWTSEPEASVPGVTLEKNHGKDGKHRKEEDGQMADDKSPMTNSGSGGAL